MPPITPILRDRLRRWALPACLAASAIAIELGGEATRVALRFERAAVLDGEVWRLVTGNLAHLGPRHLALNLVGLALLAALGGRVLVGARGAAVAFAALLGVGLGLLAFDPAVAWYVGLSGVLHGLLAARAIEACVDPPTRSWGLAVGVALALKLGWEQLAGAVPLTAAAAGGPVVVAAHLHGAVAGALAALVGAWTDRTGGRAEPRV